MRSDGSVLAALRGTRPRLDRLLPTGGLWSHATRIGWPLIDQGIASVGTFALAVTLARILTPEDYGVFVLLLAGLNVVGLVSGSLIFYPLAVRFSGDEAQGGALMATCLVFLAGLCATGCLLVGLALAAVERPEFILPSCAYLCAWQIQEAFRRYLFVQTRFAAAIPGEILSYLGQLPLLLVLARYEMLSLTTILLAMALTSAVAAVQQAISSGLFARARPIASTRAIARDFWALGSWSLANNLLSIGRVQMLLWGLAALAGASAPARFQAAMNLVNVVNPLVIGLCNVIPQTAARAHGQGKASAWRAARVFALAGAPIAGLFFLGLLVFPAEALRLVYGPGSPYLDLVVTVRLLALTALAAYSTDMICSYFHGIEAARHALTVNAAGTLTALALGLPLTAAYGITGACIALGIAGVVRLILSHRMLDRLVAA